MPRVALRRLPGGKLEFLGYVGKGGKIRKAKVSRIKNPSLPTLSSWNMYAGGTGVPDRYHSYDYRSEGRQYMIDPIPGKYASSAIRGYRLRVFGAPPHYGYHQIGGIHRSAASAAKSARVFEAKL